MNGTSLTRSTGRGAGRSTARKVGRQNSTIRYAAATAERHLASGPALDWADDKTVIDDSPTPDELPEWYPDDEDDTLLGDDESALVAPPVSSWMPWVRLSVYVADGRLSYRVHIPASDNPDIERSLRHLSDGWTATAKTLIATHPEALLCMTPLDALRAMSPDPMSKLERSAGQGSRDRRVLIATPFGLAPLWFFAQGRSDDLFNDLIRLEQTLQTGEADKLTATVISDVLRRPSVQPDSIRRAHGEALLAVAGQPGIVARYCNLWPMTTPQEFLDDLGVCSKVGRSVPVATLALIGALSPPQQLSAKTVSRPPRVVRS